LFAQLLRHAGERRWPGARANDLLCGLPKCYASPTTTTLERLERATLDALTGNAVLDTFQAAAEVFDRRPIAVSAAQLASVRRALRNLEKQRKVFGSHAFSRQRRLWSLHPADFGAIASDEADQPIFEADKLAKVLGMLGSAHPSEATAAGIAAHKLMTEAGLRWPDVIKGAKARR
jgi:soluble lytic murein transglycosylase-like protein